MLNQISSKAKRAARRIRKASLMLFGEPFTAPPEKNLYRQIDTMPEDHGNHPVIAFHPTCLGGQPVLCRPGTRDRSSLEDLLFHQTYLPPKPLHNPMVIVDLGTNVGYTVAHFAFLYPTARIIGVELDTSNFLIAQQNTNWCKDRAMLVNAAIWSSDGYVDFEGRGEDAYHVVASTVKTENAAMPNPNRRARSMSMASLINDFNITRIDYLKMDIEGGETELIFASDTGWLDCVDAMKIELHDVDYEDFHRALTARGFRCCPDGRHPSCIVAIRSQS
jgi:FkbM family methyltransferase